MANFKHDIMKVVEDDEIEAVVILGEIGYLGYNTDSRDISIIPHINKVISYSLALELLDYEYASGYGVMDCNDIHMWGKNYVYYIHEYDGSTDIHRVPRNPPDAAIANEEKKA